MTCISIPLSVTRILKFTQKGTKCVHFGFYRVKCYFTWSFFSIHALQLVTAYCCSSPVRRCSNNTCCPGCWGPRKVPGVPSSHLEAADPARVEMETRTAPPGHRCWAMNAQIVRCMHAHWLWNRHYHWVEWQRLIPTKPINNSAELYFEPNRNSTAEATYPASGSAALSSLGSSACGSEKSRARLVSFFWRNFRDSLLLLMGLPRAATIFSPCKPGIFPRRRRRFRFLLKAMQQHTLLEGKGKRFTHVRRRHMTSEWKLLRTESMQPGN